jgi:hypothetical protein
MGNTIKVVCTLTAEAQRKAGAKGEVKDLPLSAVVPALDTLSEGEILRLASKAYEVEIQARIRRVKLTKLGLAKTTTGAVKADVEMLVLNI